MTGATKVDVGAILALLCFCSLSGLRAVDQASFYGNSYISIPLKEARSSTDIHFKFKTYLGNALILLAAGTTDYCIVELENGKVKVNINLGAGESELASPPNVKLNDLQWHEVDIKRREANLSMTIDRNHRVQKQLPGKFFELNIHYGLFIGDNKNKNNTDIFFGHVEKFRGCLSALKYNDIPVLEQARYRNGQTTVQSVTWNCATEFEASTDVQISFVEDNSYMMLPQKSHSKELNLQFEARTIAKDGLLFYNPGHKSKPDFFLIELNNYHIRLVVKVGEKISKLSSKNTKISDGEWHKITFKMTYTILELTIDNGKVISEKNSNNHVYQLVENSYLGGLEVSKRFRATQKGCSKSCDISFKGCIRNLAVNDVRKGFPNAHVTEGLLPGCVWQYPCLQNPCNDKGFCIQQGLDSFQCQCQEELCVNLNYTEGYKVFSRNSLATDLELLSVDPLEVVEGRSEIVTTRNLHMILDYQKYGIKDSGIKFYVIEGPDHGIVKQDVWPHEKNSFSLLEVSRDKIHYVHDGSEVRQDSIVMEVEFFTDDTFILPEYLQGRFRFSLSIAVMAENDPPIMEVMNTTVFRTVQGTKKILSSEVFRAVDPDNPPNELIYTILESEGFFEKLDKPNHKITTFTQEDVDMGKVVFFDRSSTSNTSYISLQVSDGMETSPAYKIRVTVSPQYWRMERNTGLIVLHQTFSMITPYNLSFTSNVAIPDFSAHFTIVKRPQYGVIEVEKTMNNWVEVDVFTGDDLKQHRVRYRHVNSKPDFDEFQFRTLDKIQLYTFRITFVKCTLYRVNTKDLHLKEAWETTISGEELSFETMPPKPSTSVNYVISDPPRYGYLFSPQTRYRMRSCDTFTQEDVTMSNVKYRTFQKPYSDVEDFVSFVVLSPGCNNVTGNLSIRYTAAEEDKGRVSVNLRQLEVIEGSSAVLEPSYLYITADFVTDLSFNLTARPMNGFLQTSKTNDTDHFSLIELKNNQVSYFHDGTETESDYFTFMAFSALEDFEFVGNFNVKIDLKNDNSPVRTVDKVFHIVVGGERILSGKDLRYADDDIGTLTSNIVYTCRESSNGHFYNVNNRNVRVSEFSQEDLDLGRIVFKHRGPEYGKVRLWVTDGKFHVNGLLEVQASAPFIRVESDKKIVVQLGKSVVITEENLKYFTNLYASDRDVSYEVINKPIFGNLVSSKTFMSVKNFTQQEVNEGEISYINEHSGGNADEIGLRVRCRDALNSAQLGVWMLPSSYWGPLEPKNLKMLSVEESTSVLITKRNLEVSQTNVPPSAIVYHIVDTPDSGYITILSETNGSSEPLNVFSFSQDLVNANKILYIQSGTNQTKDKILFNVTNGIVWRRNLQLDIEVIPESLHLGTSNLVVNEGGTAVITNNHLYVMTDYYRSKINFFTIEENVKHGCVQVHKRCIKSKIFSYKELQTGLVHYSHDGSENLEDKLVITGDAGGKKSFPITLKIIILSINDQKPRLVNNTGMIMWEGGVAAITNDMLAAVDDDLPRETLKYQVQNCWWGTVSFTTDIDMPLYHFTQEQIDKQLVVFRHQNGTEGRFAFNITDGVHTTKDYIFHVKTKPVHLKLISRNLHIFPLQKKYLTSHHLLTFISDPHRLVHYDVTVPPTLGRLMMESERAAGLFKVVSSFTQNDLNTSRIFYEHTHQFSDLYANDSFVFNVRAHLVPKLTKQVLKIDISVSSGGLDAYVSIPKISVDEGGTTTIPLNLSGVVLFLESHAGLRSPIIHASAVLPSHGSVFLQYNKNLTTFTQPQLESGEVYYEHDHSDSLGDNIYFSLYLIPGYVPLCNLTVPVMVNPINDQPFVLVTPAPSLTVVQGENHTITKRELATEDADTPASKLKYSLISGPTYGKLYLLPERIPITDFSQADIDENRLVYVHDGDGSKDSFHFRIWDGKFRPEFTLFNIIVVPVSVTVTPGMPVSLLQGSDVVFLSEKQFFVSTNADKNKIIFSLRKPTRHGILYKDNAVNPFYKDKPMTTFTYSDLLDEKVMYLQTDMTTANDTFSVLAEIQAGNNSFGNEVDVWVKVQPFMHVHNLTSKAGETNRITLQILDATPLAKLTSSNPRYTVLELPKFGKVRKIIRSSGEKRKVLDTIVTSFTHEEVHSGLIYMEIGETDVPRIGIQDKMTFILAASIFQPAIGELKINVRSSLSNDISSTLAGPSDPASHEGGLHLASPTATKDYLLIGSMVIGVIILGVAIAVVIKCRSLDARLNKEQPQQPPSLPRPPADHRFSSSSSSPKPPPAESYATTMATALPQCKVTPLSRGDMDSPSPCYPYGADEQPDDWSSLDASDPPSSCPTKNIMLRRNQYWV